MPDDPSSPAGSGPVVAKDKILHTIIDGARIDVAITSGDWSIDRLPIAGQGPADGAPSPISLCHKAAKAALRGGIAGRPDLHSCLASLAPDQARGMMVELAVELADDQRVARLNADYRGKSGPTNVLSFPAFEADDLAAAFAATPPGMPLMLGDLILADGVMTAEALAQGKDFSDHLSHLVVHGVLHCLGYDHQEDDEASIMEALERRILADLGIADPYADTGPHDDKGRAGQ
ncbi:endoribonuclease YbeY [Iodidimonas nitroreducens]|uniref:Endoribonuclease YbeY n=1 Tax=Iodidimonas nitroreducens TaxID=1236968 RepID=A0A5A7N632_9PROT|nr:rRNA maturation RNase YbeY [Iodidimonas nitroreducens]GAK34755.1 endoribonuclease YbeY [alpha proteobacterium Q-1]GER02539.1 endoribonuclease YbeY [Iodidimonas nitroreducens]